MEGVSIWGFLAGLAMFVYGMHLLEDSIQELGYRQLRKWLSNMVDTRLKAIFGGTVLAGILQSGTIVSTMVIAFAGAGLLTLSTGIGVIIGGNVGGTFLGVIIAKLGFGYDISVWALPILACGGLMQFLNRKYWRDIGKLILGFGLLLFGIAYLKDSMSLFADSINLANYAHMPWYALYFGGTLVALLLHSSGTTTILAMSAMVGGILTFEQAIITMLGASIGSSLVSLYVSIGGSPIKRQIAYTHVGFNTLGAVLFLPLAGYADDIMALFMEANRSPDAIAWFQVLYNLVAALIVYPFINPLASLMQKYIQGDTKKDYILQSLAAVKQKEYKEALHNDVLIFIKKIFKFNVHHLGIDQQILLDNNYTLSEKYYAEFMLKEEKFQEDYEVLKTIEESILKSLLERLHIMNKEKDSYYLSYYQSINALMYSAKALDDSRHNFIDLHASPNLMVKERLHTLKMQMVDLYLVFSQIITDEHLKGHIKAVQETLKKVDRSNKELVDLLGTHLHRQPMPAGELSGLLHFTSALVRSHNAFLEGLSIIRDQ